MRKTYRLSFVLLVAVAFLAACGGNNTSPPSPPSGSGLLSLTMRDAPPAGVDILSFEVTVTGAVLNSSNGNVSLISQPVKVEITRLEVETAFLNTASARADTYSGITVTFANAELTIQNNTGAPIGSCASGALCELKPTISPGSVTYSGSPFPLTLSKDQPTGLLLDFNMNNSIQTDLSVNPTFSFTQLPAQQGTGKLDEIEDQYGKVTAKDTANNQFTLQHSSSGLTYTVKVDANTEFEDFDEVAGQVNGFASLAVGQAVEVDLELLAGGSFRAKKVELQQIENEDDLEGTLIAIDSPTQFRMVVSDESSDIPGIEVGNIATVTIQAGAVFRVDNDGLAVAGDLIFGSSADLLVGQELEVHRLAASSDTAITTDEVRLRMSRFTAKVKAVDAPNMAFTLDNLPALFASATPAISEIQVRVVEKTEFEEISGVAALTAGDKVSVRGLLFRTTGLPVLVAGKVRKQATT